MNTSRPHPRPLRWRIAQSLELLWWRRYLGRRDVAAYHAWKRRYWQEFLAQIGDAPPAGHERVLDAGCGPAGVFMLFDGVCEVDAVDPLLGAYERRLPHFAREMYPGVRFHAAALEAFASPIPHDRVYCLNAINHVADLDAAFDALVRAVRPGGRLCVSIDAHRRRWTRTLLRAVPADVLHPHQHGVDDYVAMLAARDCAIERRITVRRELLFDYVVLVARRAAV
jgi:SAM-dependent methyltransferase